MHAVDLGCDRTWRKTKWRSTHGIPVDTPCLGVLCDSNFSSPGLRRLERIIQEIRWRIPQLGLGVLAIDQSTFLSACNLPCHAIEIATDTSETLDWVCGVDVWLLATRSQLAMSIEQLADYLKISSLHVALAQQESANSLHKIAGELADLFELSRARLPMLAFQRAASGVSDRSHGITTDAALEILDSALSSFKNNDRLPVSPMVPTTLRLAA